MHSAESVSACIAAGWSSSPRSGFKLPVSRTKTDGYYFIGVELHPTAFSPLVTGMDHALYAVWAEVSARPGGSATRYRRAYQFGHKVIDRVVVGCQSNPDQ